MSWTIPHRLPFTPSRRKHCSRLSVRFCPLCADLFYCYKVLFGYTDLEASDFFEMAPLSTTRGHTYKLYKKRSFAVVRQKFFTERIVNI